MGFRWKITEDLVFGEFDELEIDWLRRSVPEYQRMLEHRLGEYRCYDSLCDEIGMPLPCSPLRVRPLRALRALWCGQEQDEALLWWREADLFTAMHRDTNIALETLPNSGSRVELPWSSQVHAWFWVLVNIRFAHGVSSDLPDVARCPEWELPAGKLDANSTEDLNRYTLWWLGRAAYGLREVSGQPLPELVLR